MVLRYYSTKTKLRNKKQEVLRVWSYYRLKRTCGTRPQEESKDDGLYSESKVREASHVHVIY